ncbi:MAG: beta-lactamase family protein [Saprospiraceae bacterium]|nr:MAG: beta-lactamase [Bacteroidetes bacterium OLB9]MCO6463325.1 beta-lactamase family protein [Saprospiraceae bacterium]
MRKLILTTVYTIICTILFAQNYDKEKLDRYFDTLVAHDKFMGSVVVSKDGAIIYSKAVGFSDIEHNIKANETSKYRIGSISKTFTAVLLLKAMEENKIKLDEKLSNYYPTIKNADKITIEDLLYHRSGIHSFTDDEDYESWSIQPKSKQELVNIISKGESEFEPGSKFTYSNPNYILLSFILQDIYGKTYSDLLQEKILKPIGLSNTYFGHQISAKNNECYSYSYDNKWVKARETNSSIPMGAGGIVSTPSDLTKFDEALFSGKIISKKSLELMTALKDNFGMGIFPLPFHEINGLGHTGGIDGFSSLLAYFPDNRISFALTSNGDNYNNKDIFNTVLSAVFNKPYDIPDFKTYNVTSEELDKYLGTYATKDLPLKLTITKEGDTLIAQATGQQQLPLEARGKDVFAFDRAGIILQFNPENKTVVLKQGGGIFTFTKE